MKIEDLAIEIASEVLKISGTSADIPASLIGKAITLLNQYKPATKMIHGVEVPNISFTPNLGDSFYYATTQQPSYAERFLRFNNSDLHQHLAKNGLCYPDSKEGKMASVLHTKAMLGIA